MGIQKIVVTKAQRLLLLITSYPVLAMLNYCIIKQEEVVMFLIITIFVLTVLVCVSDRLTQSLLTELTGELLTTILNPYNILQGEASIPQDVDIINIIVSVEPCIMQKGSGEWKNKKFSVIDLHV